MLSPEEMSGCPFHHRLQQPFEEQWPFDKFQPIFFAEDIDASEAASEVPRIVDNIGVHSEKYPQKKVRSLK